MGGRRRLARNLQRAFSDHRSQLARQYGREYRVICESLAIDGDPLLQREASATAFTRIRARESGRLWAELVEQRTHGRGRRPSLRMVERARRAAALDEESAKQALDRLRALVHEHRKPTLAERMAALHAERCV